MLQLYINFIAIEIVFFCEEGKQCMIIKHADLAK